MARKAIKPNATPPKKLATNPHFSFQRVLILLGKPIYIFLVIILTSIQIALEVVNTLGKEFSKYLSKLRKRKKPKPKEEIIITLSPVIPRGYFSVKKTLLLGVIILVSTASFSFWYFILKDLPSASNLIDRDVELSTKIYDRNGELLYKIYKNHNRTLVSLSQVSESVKLSTLAAEDAEFYSHRGISLRGIFRSLIKDIKTGSLVGGSTITQQLVKNTLLSPEKTITRKLKEVVLAIQVEREFSKDEILEMYLNEVSYGGPTNGIQEASQIYFGKDAANLSLSEAALLAGLPKSPSKFSPFANPDLAIERQKEVLHLMTINGYITPNEEINAKNQKLSFAPNKIDIKAPHFVMYVKEILAEKYGDNLVNEGGLEVYTTLDLNIQRQAEEIVKTELNSLKRFNVGNAAVVVLNPKSGEILAMVGSKDYFDSAHDGNVNVTLRPRQPGSSIKIINYAYALEHGFTPASIIDDSPITYSTPGSPPYSPKNYDGEFIGRVSVRSALAQSRNVPAVKILASYGVPKMITQGRKMGITTWTSPQNYGLSLTLGGAETTLLELSRVYATIANYGKIPMQRSILKIVDKKGKLIEKDGCIDSLLPPSKEDGTFSKLTSMIINSVDAGSIDCQGEQVVDSRVAFQLIDILKDNNARAPEFGFHSALVIPNHDEVAVKTGTTNELRDNLTVGFNQNYLVAVWVGNNNNTPMSNIASGITGAAPIWNKIMTKLIADEPIISWVPPDGILRTKLCDSTRSEWLLKESKLVCPKTITEKTDSKKDLAPLEGQIIEPALKFP